MRRVWHGSLASPITFGAGPPPPSCPRIAGPCRLRAPRLRQALGMAVATKGVEGIGGHSEVLPGAPEERPHGGGIRVQQDLMWPQHIAGGPTGGEGPAVHQP